MTRTDAGGQPRGGWLADQRMSATEALAGFTSGAAYAAFEESWRGRAAEGQAADLTVFDGDPTDPSKLLGLHAAMTIVGGRVVYERR
jgi:predicted amidohydrolase YtcJ